MSEILEHDAVLLRDALCIVHSAVVVLNVRPLVVGNAKYRSARIAPRTGDLNRSARIAPEPETLTVQRESDSSAGRRQFIPQLILADLDLLLDSTLPYSVWKQRRAITLVGVTNATASSVA